MPVVICRRTDFAWGLHKNRYIYVMFAILSITLFMLYMQGSVPEGYTGSQRNRMRGCEMDIDQ